MTPVSGGVVLPPEQKPYQPNEEQDLPRDEDGNVDMSRIMAGFEGMRRRANRISDDLKISRDRLDVLNIQRGFLGREREGIIELPPEEEQDVLHNNWADREITSNDTGINEEEMGLLNPEQRSIIRPPNEPLWKRIVGGLIRTPIVQNPKYYLPNEPPPSTPTAPETPSIPPPITNRTETDAFPMEPEMIPDESFSVETYPVPVYIPQAQINLTPIFLSGIAFASLLLGLPLWFL